MSSQVRSGAEILGWRKISQLQMKLTRTAAMETKLLSGLDRRVNSVIAIAEASGHSKTCHGSMLVITSEF
jgi:hypothetical protein